MQELKSKVSNIRSSVSGTLGKLTGEVEQTSAWLKDQEGKLDKVFTDVESTLDKFDSGVKARADGALAKLDALEK